ncbi:MAG: SDR family NAD(P)-dependent oxidoreductase [Acidimicrobiaceae bacterium]|nr:SDR family NAD(P)-dependent oxidoreductase [Acidimicrobiaceae bacterium]MDE0606972.1 SDR family NAD(P)-dependent oxidoreductase [Acidimicrobiaceae bacterium]
MSEQTATELADHRYVGKVAAVTGAASGMGRCIALRLAAEGATVFGMDLNADGLDEVAAEAADAAAAGGAVHTRVIDIADPAECHAAIAQCVARYGRLDVLGNIAAISWMKHAVDVTIDDWREMFAINVDGTFFMCQAALPHIIESEGSIINIASNAAFMGSAYLAPYCATKGAVVQMTRALATEFVKEPIRINAIAPGGTDTPMNRDYQLAENTDYKLLMRSMAFRPLDKPEHVAALFAFLASAEAANIHGAVINADSGMTAT